MNSYGALFSLPAAWWHTTVSLEDDASRARKRHCIRAYANTVWAGVKASGVPRVQRFMLLVGIAAPQGKTNVPVFAAEPVKPVVDAGTDQGLWPDDDPRHRVWTGYYKLPDSRDSQYKVLVQVIGLPGGVEPTLELTRLFGGRFSRTVVSLGDEVWLTSNMREARRKARVLAGINDQAAHAFLRWPTLGDQVWVNASIGYPNPAYLGDPDNSAETVSALLGVAALQGRLGENPLLVSFDLDPACSGAHRHSVSLRAVRVPAKPVKTICEHMESLR